MSHNLSRGKAGENFARKFLINKGYKILETNYKNRIGEIDLIAFDEDILVFIEVKARTNFKYGYPYEAVDLRKQRKIINTSLLYVQYKNYIDTQIRYDIIEIYVIYTSTHLISTRSTLIRQ